MTKAVLLLVLLAISLVDALKTIVIVRDMVDKTTYSQFLRDLKTRGHSLTFKTASDASIDLEAYGVYNYDNLVVLSPSSKKLGDVTAKALLKFLDAGKNAFIGLDEKVSKMFKNLASNLGIEVRTDVVKDHFAFNELVNDSKNHSYITTEAAFGEPVTRKVKNPIAYRGIGFTLKSKTDFGLHLLTPESTGYNKFASGKNLGLVTALQLRNNARVTFVGGLSLLSNEFAMKHVQVAGERMQSGNREFVKDAVAWTFKERGALRTSGYMHYLLGEENPVTNPNRYTIKQRVHLELKIEQYDLSSQTWIPFEVDDVEFQLVRLDPFIRTLMKDEGNGFFVLEFTLPDIFGIFKFIVDYKRKGYTYIYEELEAGVRPLRHNQHERFLVSAFPYYAAMFSMIFGFFSFGFLFLHTEEQKAKEE